MRKISISTLWDVTTALAVVFASAVTFPSEWMDWLQHCWSHTETCGCVFVIFRASVLRLVFCFLHYNNRFDLIRTVARASSGTCHGLVSDNGSMSHCCGCFLMRDCCLTSLLLQLRLQGNGQSEGRARFTKWMLCLQTAGWFCSPGNVCECVWS